MQEPRKPTPEVIRALSRFTGCSEEDVQCMAYGAVFDYYITDSPGYAGKLMMVVWSGGPSLYEVFTWNQQEELQRRAQDKHQ